MPTAIARHGPAKGETQPFVSFRHTTGQQGRPKAFYLASEGAPILVGCPLHDALIQAEALNRITL